MSLMLAKPKREIDTKYTRWIKQQPCFGIAAAGMLGEYARSCEGPMDHHHVKEQGHGIMGSKVSDRRSIPACRRHHQMAEASPNYFRSFFAVLIRDLNAMYDAQHKPAKPVKERKVSPTVQHISVKCSCGVTHKVPPRKVLSFEPFVFWCQASRSKKEAKTRRGA